MNLDSNALKSLSVELGCDHSNLGQDEEAEAGRLWDALNQLANDPVAYQNFMAKQLQHLDSSKDGEVTLNQQSASSAVPPFVPLPGFVVKTFTQTKMFVNICHHGTTVPKPIDENGNAVADSCQEFENVQVPLIISKSRNCLDGGDNKAMAVDVVVNSWCIGACEKSASFKEGLVALSLNSITEDHSMRVEARGQMPWKFIKSKYKAGLGKNGTSPRPFEDSQEPKSMKMEQVPESPSELLRCRDEQKEQSQSKQQDLQLPQTDKKLIEEVHSHQPTSAAATAIEGCPPKKGPAITPVDTTSMISNGLTNGQETKVAIDPEFQGMGTGKGLRESADPDIVQTLKDLSNVMSGVILGNDDKQETHGNSEDFTPSGCGSSNMTMTNDGNGGKVLLQFDLSSCQQKINSMDDLDLKMSEESVILVVPKCDQTWSAKFPHPVNIGNVSATFQRKQQMLVVVCSLARDEAKNDDGKEPVVVCLQK